LRPSRVFFVFANRGIREQRNQRRAPSLRGALATKQSSLGALRPLDCFAALAMTVGSIRAVNWRVTV
jgi:hypothetical protein